MARNGATSSSRRAAWLGFFIVIIAALNIVHAQVQEPLQGGGNPESAVNEKVDTSYSIKTYDPSLEATRAYKQALSNLKLVLGLSPPLASQSDNDPHASSAQSNSIIAALFPGLSTQGPIASAIRIVFKLAGKVSRVVCSIGNGFGLGGGKEWLGGRRREDEIRDRVVRVVDLLELAGELGNTEAWYKLAQLSMFSPTPLLTNYTRAFHAYNAHVQQTGNASSHAMLGFFYSTGYQNIVPIDTPKALLHYTFGAQGGDRGAQMALGYKYSSGISVNDDCATALEWYQAAAEQSMVKFLSGPPGGLAPPLTATKLSDLAGGAFGPGASVASTGLNAHRAVIKAALARSAGETWEDVLEYYLFNADRGETDFAFRLGKIFYQGSIYPLPGGIASGADGVGAIPRDFHRARSYFLRIARAIWPRDNPHSPNAGSLAKKGDKDGETRVPVGYAAEAASYLGRMYLRGEGMKQDFMLARMWFERGAEYGERESYNGLGFIWRDGLGLAPGKADLKKALHYFLQAANQDVAEAHVQLGKYRYQRNELKLAQTHFENAVRLGSQIEAYFYLAEMHASHSRVPATQQVLRNPILTSDPGSCAIAVNFFKTVAERGVWSDAPTSGGHLPQAMGWAPAPNGGGMGSMGVVEGDLVREGEMLWKVGTEWAKEQARLRWWIAAEHGIETAQNNLAFVLDQGRGMLHTVPYLSSVPVIGKMLTTLNPPISNNSHAVARLALTHWSRSAAQRNIDALVKVGDYYYHGLGVDAGNIYDDEKERQAASRAQKSDAQVRLEKAALYYQSAVQTQVSALAMWNMGWMYENGVGVPRDFHLAKRHYDMALETNSEAYLPVTLSLVKLHMKSLWHTIMGGKEGLALWNDDAAAQRKDLAKRALESRGREERAPTGDVIAADTAEPATELGTEQYDDYQDDLDAGEWYPGRAREEHMKKLKMAERARLAGQPGHGEAGDVEDPIQWARDRRQAEADRERDRDDYGPEDYFEGALRAARRHGHTHGDPRPGVEDGVEAEDEFTETMILVILCMAVSVLIWLRGRWVEQRRREEEQRRAAGPAADVPPLNLGARADQGGLFPPRGDPARDEWAMIR